MNGMMWVICSYRWCCFKTEFKWLSDECRL